MSYQPPKINKSSSQYSGTKGTAKVGLNPDRSKAQIDFYKKEGNNEVHIKRIVVSTFPDYLKTGRWYVRMSSDDKEVLSANPQKGMFTVRVNKFVAPENEEPTPKSKEGNYNGKPYTYQEFYVWLETLKPDSFQGMPLFLTLRYNFDGEYIDMKGKQVEVVGYSHPQSASTGMLMDFCDATGVWEKGPMPYQANILPVMAKRIAHANKTFQIVYDEGWPKTIFSMDTEEDEPDKDDIKFEDSSDFEPTIEEAPF